MFQKYICFFFLLTLLTSPINSLDDPDSETEEAKDDVLVLTDDTFDEALKSHEFLLVEFYAPWCGHCKSLAPHYSKAATTLLNRERPVTLAKLDATVNPKHAEQYNVKGFPTLYWFVNGTSTPYKGGRDAEGIVKWVDLMLRPPATMFLTQEEVTEFVASAQDEALVVAHVASEEDLLLYESVARGKEGVRFGAIRTDSGAATRVVVYKRFEADQHAEVEFSGAFVQQEVSKFVLRQTMPLLIPFSPELTSRVLDLNIPSLLIYIDDPHSEGFHDRANMLKSLSLAYLQDVVFLYVEKDSEMQKNLELSSDKLPSVVIVKLTKEDVVQFEYEQAFERELLEKYVQEYLSGGLRPKRKSQDPPQPNLGPVTVAVGSTLESIALDEERDVLVEFYAPWCGHCKALAPIYEKLGKHFEGEPSVVIAKMDATENDIGLENVSVRGYPTLVLFPKHDKQHPVVFKGGRNLDSLVQFVEENAQSLTSRAEGAEAHSEL